MTSRLALCATVATTVFCITGGGEEGSEGGEGRGGGGEGGEGGGGGSGVGGGDEGGGGVGAGGAVYLTEAFTGQVSKVESQRRADRDRQGPENARRHSRWRSTANLIVAEVGVKRIVRIDPAKGTVTEIAANLPIGLPAAPGGLPSNIPTGVGVGATGTIYFSSDIENAIYKLRGSSRRARVSPGAVRKS